MGCGISTNNLPSYMRGRRDPNSKKNQKLGWENDKDDQKIPIIDNNKVDSNEVDRTSVSSSAVKNLPKIGLGDKKERDVINNNNNSLEANKDRKGHEGEDNESQFDEARGSNIGNMSWVGSPSFREYCETQYDSMNEDDKSDAEFKDAKRQERLSDASSIPNEGPTQGRPSMSRLRKVFPAGKPTMKNLLNAATCYNPNHATSRADETSQAVATK